MMSSRLWTYLGKEPVTPHPDATQREGTLWGPHTRGAQGALGHGPFSQRGSGPPQPGTPPQKKLLPHETTLCLLGVQACSPHFPHQ